MSREPATTARTADPVLGLRGNLPQFLLLVAVNALVGGMIGQERTVLPLLAERTFGLTAFTASLTFIAAFGIVKAATNFFAGTLSDRYGRKPVLVAGWLAARWGLGQLYTGGLSDRMGRKPLIAGGMLVQAVALAWMATVTSFAAWALGAVILGAGTAMVYPTLLAAIGDVAHPSWRARSVGLYRLWRDGGFAVGALLAGILADLISIQAAIYTVAALTGLSGLIVAARMYETHHPPTAADSASRRSPFQR